MTPAPRLALGLTLACALFADPAQAGAPPPADGAQASTAGAGEPAPDPGKPTELEVITVTASRIPRAMSDVPISLSLIDSAAMAEQLAISTNVLEGIDVLVPGLTTSQEEARTGCNTNIRGRPAQFLINGVPTNDNLRRSSCRSLYSISPFALDRVEVLRGATALYGAGAPGGAINLITRRARSEALQTDFVAAWGVNPYEADDSGETNIYAGLGQAVDWGDYYAGLSYQDYGVRRNPDGGIIQGTTFESWSFNTAVAFKIADAGELRFTGFHYDEDPEDFYGLDFTAISGERLAGSAFIAEPRNPYEDQAGTTQSLLAVSYDQGEFFGHTLSASAYWHREELIQRAADWFEGVVYYFDSDAENERQGVRLALNKLADTASGTWDITYGIDVLSQRYYRPVVDPATGAIVNFVAPEVLLDSTALFVQPQFRRGQWLFSGGVRHERFDGEVGDEGYDPSIPNATVPGETPDFSLSLFNAGVIYDFSDSLQVFGSFSQGAEISEFGRAARGVQDPATINLDAATSEQFELGVRGRAADADFSAAVFRSHSDKAATLQPDPSCAGEPLCPLIPLRQEQTFHGIELTADWQVAESTRLGGLFTWQRGEFEDEGAPPIDFGSGTLAPQRTTVYVEIEPVERWQNRLQATYYGATDFYDADEEAQGYRDSDSVFLMDFSTSTRLGTGKVSLGVSNLLNEEYVNVTNQASGDFYYYLSEGRRVTLGYDVRF